MRRLRGHHLFCATLFQGHGYDQTFTTSMTDTVDAINTGEPLILVTGSDDLCKACPHRRPDNGCALGTEDVARRDQAALDAVGLCQGVELSSSQVGERLHQVSQAQWESVCGGCRWQAEGLCSWELFQRMLGERFLP